MIQNLDELEHSFETTCLIIINKNDLKQDFNNKGFELVYCSDENDLCYLKRKE